MQKRNEIRIVVILTLAVLAVASTADAYTYTADDSTDYDWADGVYSIFTFSSVSLDTDTGEMKACGGNGWYALHTCKLWMAMEFTAPSTGRVHCSADLSLSYNLIAGKTAGGYSSMQINLVLMDSSHNPLETDQIYYREAYYSSGDDYVNELGTPAISEAVYWSYTLQSSTVYYATVEIYIKLFNGGWAFSYAGDVDPWNPTILSCDVSEIYVYS
jgi:hypothetical protein